MGCLIAIRSVLGITFLRKIFKGNNSHSEIDTISNSETLDSSTSQRQIIEYLCRELSIKNSDLEKSITKDLRINYPELERVIKIMQLDNKLPISEDDISNSSSVISISETINERLNRA